MDQKFPVQPINESLESIQDVFARNRRMNPFNRQNLDAIFNDTDACESYTSLLLQNVGDEGVRNGLKRTIKNSMSQYTDNAMFANLSKAQEEFEKVCATTEGLLTATQPGNNMGIYDPLAPAVIVGSFARTYQLDVVTPLNHDKYEWTFAFTVTHVAKENAQGETELYVNPDAYRSGAIRGLNNTEFVKGYYIDNSGAEAVYVVPQTKGAAPVVTTGLYKAADGSAIIAVGSTPPAAPVVVGANDGAVISIIKSGTISNIVKMDGKRIQDWALAEDMRVQYVLVDNSVDGDGSSLVIQKINVRNRTVARGLAEAADRDLNVNVRITLTDGTVTTDLMKISVNRDSGDFASTQSSNGRIVGFSLAIPYLNPMNLMETIQAGRRTYTARVLPQPKLAMAQPLSIDTVSDEFVKTNGEKTDMVKWAINEFSTALASINDNNLEAFMTEEISDSIADPMKIEEYQAFKRLKGFAAGEDIDFTKRGPGGENPFAWLEVSAKDTVRNLMTMAETYTNISKESDNEWVMFGYANDIARFIDQKYESQASKTEDSVLSDTKYGFKKLYRGSIMDVFGQRVSLIGITDERWLTDDMLKGQVYGWQRSNTPNTQPTAVYHGYDARILRLRTHGQGSVDSIMFFVHDGWDILTMSGIKLNVNNATNLGETIADNISIRTIVTP